MTTIRMKQNAVDFSQVHINVSPKTQAVMAILGSAFFFALMNALSRQAGEVPVAQKCFFRNIISIPIAAFILWRERPEMTSSVHNLPGLLLRAVLGTIGMTANFYAVDHMLLADATILSRLSPFATLLLSWWFLGERLGRLQAGSVAVAFLGALCIIRPGAAALTSVPALIGLMGGIATGAAYTAVRWLTQRKVSPAVVVFSYSLISCLFMLPQLIFAYCPMTNQQLVYLLAAGVAATGAQFCLTVGYAKAPSREISAYEYTTVIFAALLGFVMFGQIPDLFSWLGYGIIIGVAVLMFWYNKRQQQEDEPAPCGEESAVKQAGAGFLR